MKKSGIVAEEVKRRTGNEVISDMSYKEWEQCKKGQKKVDIPNEKAIIKEKQKPYCPKKKL